MAGSRQTTLFHSWGKSGDASSSSTTNVAVADGLPEDDDMLLAACQAWETGTSRVEERPLSASKATSSNNAGGRTSTNASNDQRPQNNSRSSFPPLPPPHGTQLEDLPGFDLTAGDIWIYPTNYPVRDYQYNIVKQALFKNTMVTLPTGLGKTFIAAVVMYNFFRWYPQGKIVFMAPTKPLVAQQIEACYNIMGIPQSHMIEMTGNIAPPERKKCWLTKRMFFLTPQVLMNDLSRGACPVEDIKCLVVDEAHKALGNHAYCQVVNEIIKYTLQFRVLALSATPGGDLKSVQQVLQNMRVSHIEIRAEDSIDIKPYAHERKVEKVVVPLGEELKSVRDLYLQIISVYTQRLVRCGALYRKPPESLTKFELLQKREAFRRDPPQQVTSMGAVEGDFAISISLYHGFELLMHHGMRSLYNFLQSTVDTAKGYSRTKQELLRNGDFQNLMEILSDKFRHSANSSLNTSGSATNLNSSKLFTSPGTYQRAPSASQLSPFVMSHPKLDKLQNVVVDHFKNFSIKISDPNKPSTSTTSSVSSAVPAAAKTRVMIFAQYRDSVQEITHMLNRHQPLIRCMSFIGQATAGKNTKGFTQKEQLRVVREFKEGSYNTLVSTCVGEEGLDIGDVDLIVCYDAHKSPIRLVQRMGRTGRKREGRIVMLVTEGKEAAIYDRSQYNKKGIHKALQGNSKSLQLYPNNPRMVPRGLDPTPHKMHITVDKFVTNQKKDRKSKIGGRKSAAGSGGIMNFVKPSKPADKCFLTSDELAQWSELYQVHGPDADTTAKIPDGGHFVTLRGKQQQQQQQQQQQHSEANDKQTKPTVSLNQWSLWQNRRQPTINMDNSKRTKNFVELMQFVELQGQIDDDDDPYGLEMETYLDKDDILKPGSSNEKFMETGIKQFCKKVGDKQQQQQRRKFVDSSSDSDVAIVVLAPPGKSEETGRSSKTKNRTKKQRRVLEMFSQDAPNSSDEELPNVMGSNDEAPKSPVFDQGKEVRQQSQTTTKPGKVTGSSPKKETFGSEGDVKRGRKKSKRKARRICPVIESSDDDDDFEDDPRSKNKNSNEIPAQGACPSRGNDDGGADKVEDVDDHVEIGGDMDSPKPMDTGNDTQQSSPEDATLTELPNVGIDIPNKMIASPNKVIASPNKVIASPNKVIASPNKKIGSLDGVISNTSLQGRNLNGSRLSLTADLSNFFPNCSQIASGANVCNNKAKQTLVDQKQNHDIPVIKTNIPPPPPSMSSLDLLDDMNLSLNTTPGLDDLTTALLLSPKQGNGQLPEMVTGLSNLPSKVSEHKVTESPLQNVIVESCQDNDDVMLEDDPSSPELIAFSPNKADASPHKADDIPNKADASPEMLTESPNKADASPEMLPESPNEADASLNEADASQDEANASPNKVDESPNKVEEISNQADESPHRKVAAEGDEVSFTLGDDFFGDCLSFGEPSDEKDGIPPIPDNAKTIVREEASYNITEMNEVTFDPMPFDFKTPKMCNKTVTGQIDCHQKSLITQRTENMINRSPISRTSKVTNEVLCEPMLEVTERHPSDSDTETVMQTKTTNSQCAVPISPIKVRKSPNELTCSPNIVVESPNKLTELQEHTPGSNAYTETKKPCVSTTETKKHVISYVACSDQDQLAVAGSSNCFNSSATSTLGDIKNSSSTTSNISPGTTNKASYHQVVKPNAIVSKTSECNEKDSDLPIPQFDLNFDLEPQFDLDFDLDTLDDDELEAMDIIPPSPTAVRQQEYLSQGPRNSLLNQSAMQTFSTPTMLKFEKDVSDRPASSTPMQGKQAHLMGMGTSFVSPISSRRQSTVKKEAVVINPTTVAKSYSSFSDKPNSEGVDVQEHMSEASNDSPMLKFNTEDVNNAECSSTFQRMCPLFKHGNGSYLSGKDTDTSVVRKRKSSSPPAPSGLPKNDAKRRRSVPEVYPDSVNRQDVCEESPSADNSRPGLHEHRHKSLAETSEMGEMSIVDLADWANVEDDNKVADCKDYEHSVDSRNTTPVLKVTPILNNSESDDDGDLVPAIRKRKKATAMPSPATPTFKTPGKPPRKVSRRSCSGADPPRPAVLQFSSSEPSKLTSLELSSPYPRESPLCDEDSDDEDDVMPGARRRRRVVALDSPLTQVVKSPVVTSPGDLMHDSEDEEEEDDDIVPGVRRKRKAMALVDSPLTQVVKSPPKGLAQRLKNKMKKGAAIKPPSNTGSDDNFDLESPLIRRRQPKKLSKSVLARKAILELNEDDDDFDVGQFTSVLNRKKVTSKKKSSSSSDDVSVQRHMGMARRKKKGSSHRANVNSEMVRGFLDDDVGVSDSDDCSSDESGSDLDNSLEGFIASQLSQGGVNESDMRAIYMKSVRSPEMNNRFKMVRGRDHGLEVFSQMPVQDESYGENSFVVNEDEEVMEERHPSLACLKDDYEGSMMENTCIDVDNIVSEGRRTRRRPAMSKAEKILKQGRRKVLMSTSSSDEDVPEIVSSRGSRLDREASRYGGRNSSCMPGRDDQMQKPDHRNGRRAEVGKVKMCVTKKTAPAIVTRPRSGLNQVSREPCESMTTQCKTNRLSRQVENRTALATNLSLMNSTNNASSRVSMAKPDCLDARKTASLIGGTETPAFSVRTNVSTSSSDGEVVVGGLTLEEKAKAERLRRQQEQQRLFRMRMEKNKQQDQGARTSSPGAGPVKSLNSKVSNVTALPHSARQSDQKSSSGTNTAAAHRVTASNNTSAVAQQNRSTSSRGITMSPPMLTSPQKSGSQKKLTVLIDSKELAASSHIVSTLTLQHSINATVCKLNGCDFIVSNRMGVEKKTWSDFSNGANRAKLVDRIRHLCQLFDRPCLIIEKDRVKPRDEKKPKPMLRTKYVDSTLANLAMTHIKVFFSESVDDTARILSDLAKAEASKGMTISAVSDDKQVTEQVLKYYQSIPRVSYPLATTLLKNFTNVQEVITSSVARLQRKANISEQRAKDLHQFFRHRYDEQMTPGRGTKR